MRKWLLWLAANAGPQEPIFPGPSGDASGVGGEFTGILRKQGHYPTIAPAPMVSSAVMKMLALSFGTDEVMFSVTGANRN